MTERNGSLLSILDLTPESLEGLVERGVALKRGGDLPSSALRGRLVAQLFLQPSTRTRTSFFWAVAKMGGTCITYSDRDLQLGNGESLGDTAMALSNHLDVLVVRTNGSHEELQVLRNHAQPTAVINALCEREHPTQAIADLVTMREEFGSLRGRHLLYVGLPCNTMNSLVLACAMLGGMRLTVVNPEQAPVEAWLRAATAQLASPATVKFVSRFCEVDEPADVVYATRWESMGVAPMFPDWRRVRQEFALDERRVERLLSKTGIVMHDLPATRGAEMDDATLDGARSRIRAQSYNKGIAAIVALERAVRS
jgi:ornithine carbamoyltransferase